MINSLCSKCNSRLITGVYDGGSQLCHKGHAFHKCNYENKLVSESVNDCKYNCVWSKIKNHTSYNYSNVKPL